MFEYIFNITNLCRLLLYPPIIFFGSLAGSIVYDYIYISMRMHALWSELCIFEGIENYL